jgi:hypothetical protein
VLCSWYYLITPLFMSLGDLGLSAPSPLPKQSNVLVTIQLLGEYFEWYYPTLNCFC